MFFTLKHSIIVLCCFDGVIPVMKKIPDGALLQKSKNNVSYVYFPSYYYDKNAKTHNKEKQKRLYIGKVVNGEFIPNKKYLANPELSRKDVGSLIAESADLSKIRSRSFGATFLLQTLAEKYGLAEDLTSVYGEELANQLLSLAMFMTLESQSALSLYPLWQRRFWVPSDRDMPSQYTSRLLCKLGEDEASLNEFFRARAKHVRASEYLSYDSTKIASTSKNINDVRWAPSKAGNYQQEISLAVLCGQKSRIPVMFRVLPGNVPDVRTVHDLLCHWDEIGIVKDATAVLDRGYTSNDNLVELCDLGVKFVVGQKTSLKLVRDCIEQNMPKFWESKCYIGEFNLYGVSHQTHVTGSDKKQHPVWVHVFRSDQNCSVATATLERKLVEYEQAWINGTASKSAPIKSLFELTEREPGDGSCLVRNFEMIDREIRYKGFFAFASNSISTAREALAVYRGRDCVEKTFSNLQTGLDLCSTGVHHDATLRGKLLICLIALTMLAALSYEMENEKTVDDQKLPRLYQHFTVNSLLHEIMNIQMISGPGISPRLTEATQKQLVIYDRVGISRPTVFIYTV